MSRVWLKVTFSLIQYLTYNLLYSFFTVPRLAETVTITYVEADGTEKEVQAEIGKNLMEVAHDNNVELEGMPKI